MTLTVLADTEGMSRAEWLQLRTNGIGSSDAAAVVGQSPYETAYSLWMDKTGRSYPDRDSESREWGRRLEDAVATKFADEHPEFEVIKRSVIVQSSEHPVVIASLDREVYEGELFAGPLECKTWSAFDRYAWDGDLMPTYIVIQTQHQICATDAERLWLALLIGGSDYVEREVLRDQRLIDGLVELEERFWDEYVLADVPPPLDGLAPTTEALKAAYADSTPGAETDLPWPQADEVLRAYKAYDAAIKEATRGKDEAANQLRVWLGVNEIGKVGGTVAVTWKSQSDDRLDTKRLRKEQPSIAAEYTTAGTKRVLRIKEGAV